MQQPQDQKTPMTSSELSEKINQLVTSVKRLEENYDEFMASKGIREDAGKLMEHQTEFWNENVAAIIKEITQSETKDNHMVDHCRLLWDNCFFTRFYNEKILDDWLATETDLRKLTILLGIHNLKNRTKLNEQPVDDEVKTSDIEADSETEHEPITSMPCQQDSPDEVVPWVSDVEQTDSEDIHTPNLDETDEIIDSTHISHDTVSPSIEHAEADAEEDDTWLLVKSGKVVDVAQVSHHAVSPSIEDAEEIDSHTD